MNDQGRVGRLRPDPLLSFHVRRLGTNRLSSTDPFVTKRIRERQNILAEYAKLEKNKINPYRPAADVLADGAWRGETCFIVGGGPSLRGFDFERLRGRGRIIVINRAFEFAPFADVLFFMDKKFYKLYHDGRFPEKQAQWNSFAGLRIFLNLSGYRFEDVYSIRSLGRNGLSNSIAKGFYHGNNSGHGALNLAYCLGASPIYLLGYDMKSDGKVSHFHTGYGLAVPDHIVRGFARDLERQMRLFGRTATKIVNLNPDSALRCYPFSTFEEVINDGKTREGLGDDRPALRDADDRAPSS